MNQIRSRRGAVRALIASGTAVIWPVLRAQDAYPSRPLRLICGFSPGGAADILARVVAQGLADELGQQVIVDNKPGADGIIAAQELFKAPTDGHTFMLGTNTAIVAVPSLRPKPPYDPFKAFLPISSAGEFSMFLTVSPALPSGSLKEFMDHIVAHPGKYSSGSSNSAAELAMLQLLGTRGAKVVNVRYKGDVPAMTDMVGGAIHMIFSTGTQAPQFVKQGRAKALVTLLPQRSPLLPEVPTAVELGIGQLTITPWAGFFAAAETASQVVRKLSFALRKTLARSEVREKLVAQGFSAYGLAPAEFAAFVRRQYDAFNQTVKEHNVKFD